MSYQDELNRLQNIITSDDTKHEQREAARKALRKLIDASIQEAFIRFQDRTEKYNALINRLKGIIDDIAANKLTGVISSLNDLLSEVKE